MYFSTAHYLPALPLLQQYILRTFFSLDAKEGRSTARSSIYNGCRAYSSLGDTPVLRAYVVVIILSEDLLILF